jgi:hypothetical protein
MKVLMCLLDRCLAIVRWSLTPDLPQNDTKTAHIRVSKVANMCEYNTHLYTSDFSVKESC